MKSIHLTIFLVAGLASCLAQLGVKTRTYGSKQSNLQQDTHGTGTLGGAFGLGGSTAVKTGSASITVEKSYGSDGNLDSTWSKSGTAGGKISGSSTYGSYGSSNLLNTGTSGSDGGGTVSKTGSYSKNVQIGGSLGDGFGIGGSFGASIGGKGGTSGGYDDHSGGTVTKTGSYSKNVQIGGGLSDGFGIGGSFGTSIGGKGSASGTSYGDHGSHGGGTVTRTGSYSKNVQVGGSLGDGFGIGGAGGKISGSSTYGSYGSSNLLNTGTSGSGEGGTVSKTGSYSKNVQIGGGLGDGFGIGGSFGASIGGKGGTSGSYEDHSGGTVTKTGSYSKNVQIGGGLGDGFGIGGSFGTSIGGKGSASGTSYGDHGSLDGGTVTRTGSYSKNVQIGGGIGGGLSESFGLGTSGGHSDYGSYGGGTVTKTSVSKNIQIGGGTGFGDGYGHGGTYETSGSVKTGSAGGHIDFGTHGGGTVSKTGSYSKNVQLGGGFGDTYGVGGGHLDYETHGGGSVTSGSKNVQIGGGFGDSHPYGGSTGGHIDFGTHGGGGTVTKTGSYSKNVQIGGGLGGTYETSGGIKGGSYGHTEFGTGYESGGGIKTGSMTKHVEISGGYGGGHGGTYGTGQFGFGGADVDGSHTISKTMSGSFTKNELSNNYGCPKLKIYGSMRCDGSNTCSISCQEGYEFPNADTKISISCFDGTWVVKDGLFSEVPTCAPACPVKCILNKGICYEPNKCSCPENLSGPFCEIKRSFCDAALQLSKRPALAAMKCDSKSCTATCMEGTEFPDGSSIANLKCIDGNYVPSDTRLKVLPNCTFVCKPPCKSGGYCGGPNYCACNQGYAGNRCQYNMNTTCSYKQLKAMGRYDCTFDDTQMECTVKCMGNAKFDDTPADKYVCQFVKNYFEPQKKAPNCRYPDGRIVTGEFSYSLHDSRSMSFNYIAGPTNVTTKHVDDLEFYEVITTTITFDVMQRRRNRQKNIIYESEDTNTYYGAPGTYIMSYSMDTTMSYKGPQGGICTTWGGMNVKTFDGVSYQIPIYCSHILVQDYVDGTFSVILNACPHGSSADCPHSLEIFLQNIKYIFSNEGGKLKLSTPSTVLPIPAQTEGMRVTPVAQHLKIDLEGIGLTITWDTHKFVTVEANGNLWNRTSGLCGTLDRNYKNDFMSRDGVVLKTSKTFLDSWKSKSPDDDQNCDMEDPIEFDPVKDCKQEIEEKGFEVCSKLLNNAKLQPCLKSYNSSIMLEKCVDDYCGCPNKSNRETCICSSISVLAKECQFKGIKLVHGWRDLQICPFKCNPGRVYLPCGPDFEPTCGSAIVPTKGACHEGCFCPEGYVQSNNECILEELCPCQIRNKFFKPGSKVKRDCNSCTCENGKWECSEIVCGARCGAIGDPHYMTFDGKRYDFMGKCSYYLFKTENLTIEAENVACPGSISESMNFAPTAVVGMPSCTKSVTLNLLINGKDTTINLKQGRLVYVDNYEITKFPKVLGDGLVIIRQSSSLFLSVDFADGVRVWWDGMTRVYIDVPANYRGRTKGLCGTFNSNMQDDLLTPEGDIESSIEPFADKWRTNEMCGYVSDMQSAPHACQLNPANKVKAEELCGKLTEEIFEDCHWSVDPAPFYEDCMYDVCACMGDLSTCLCPILAAYGAECTRQGINTNWRRSVKECALKCPAGQVYDECGDSCARTCSDIATKHICKGHCVEGCRCPLGQYLNDKNECIPDKLCPCIYDGFDFEPGYKEVRPGRRFLELCTCAGGMWDCYEAKPGDTEKYPPAAETKMKCTNKPFSVFNKCLPKEPETCKNMHSYNEDLSDCKPGCVCQTGYVLDISRDKCVQPEDCSCHHGGRSYDDGNVIKEDCNTCKCMSGSWACTTNACDSTCSVWGDSHFTTFDGKDFDFQGACDYVLSKGIQPGGDGFTITIQNVLCGSLGVTCSKSLKISLCGKSTDSITLSSDPSQTTSLQKYKKIESGSTNAFTVYNAGIFTVIEVQSLALQVKWDRGTRVYVKLGDKWRNKISGLCGNYNGDSQDDMKTPSMGLETSPLLFGHSWKLQEFCSVPTEPIDACSQHPERKTWAQRKCGILKSQIFQACHSEVPIDKYLKRCIFDTCACDQGGDCECLCTSLAAYAYACAAKGIPIRWRTPDLCPMQCDAHCSEYSACVPSCPVETCDNFLEQGGSQRACMKETCFEGCQIKPCEEGKIYLNDTFKECVPKSFCKPICLDKDGVIYYEGDVIEEDECHTCRCSRKKEICSGVPCTTTTTTSEKPQDTIPSECTTGWTNWYNDDQAPVLKSTGVKTSTKRSKYKDNDIEPIPKYLELQSKYGFGSCSKDYIKKIECRVVGSHEIWHETNDNVECNLDKGLICVGQCLDYEVRVFCDCDTTILPITTMSPLTDACDINRDKEYAEYPGDCHKFLHCSPQIGGRWVYVEKSCGPDMMYNPIAMVCDFIHSVKAIKPFCGELIVTTPPPTTQPSYVVKPKLCDPNIPHVNFPGDCQKFLHCTIQLDGSWSYVEKICGPGTLFNPELMICDWPASVYKIKPQCGENVITTPPTVEKCPPGKKWSQCATPCGYACHFYEKTLFNANICKLYSEKCEEGCVDIDLPIGCPSYHLWRDKNSCVEIEDCPCMSYNGELVKPHETFQESECEICQCLDNHYTCHKTQCSENLVTTEIPVTIEPEYLVPSEGKLIIITNPVTPPKTCPNDNLIPVVNGDPPLPDSAFSASSVLNPSFEAHFARLNNKPNEFSNGSWIPKINDQMQHLTIEFPQPTPLYGVAMQGCPVKNEYVTRFKILYSLDGIAFSYLEGRNELPQIFDGPVNSQIAIQTLFEIPIEAKMVKIYPLKWVGSISMRVELLGCGSKKPEPHGPRTTTPRPRYTVVPTPEPVYVNPIKPICEDPLGVENSEMSPDMVKASTMKPIFWGDQQPELFDLLKLSSDQGWRPALDSPNEYVQFNFREPRNLTGIKTKGGPNGWVTSFNVKYSSNGNIWNTVRGPDRLPKMYLANQDSDTPKVNYFEHPVLAQYARVIPVTWQKAIEMRIEPIGCYHPYPIEEEPEIIVTVQPKKSSRECKVCPEAENIAPAKDENGCKCKGTLYWNGQICVERHQCPCIVGHMPYDVGAKFYSEDCMECVCVLNGIPKCKPLSCEKCEKGYRLMKTETCQCTCEKCPPFYKMCPTSGDCIPERLWCDGTFDCDDDELDCEITIVPQIKIERNITIERKCPPPHCPPGMILEAIDKNKNVTDMLSAGMRGLQRSKINSEKYKKFYKEYTAKLAEESAANCFEYKCIPDNRANVTKDANIKITCTKPMCPDGYKVKIGTTPSGENSDCIPYSCLKIAEKSARCLVDGRTFKTFDGTEYKYDICSHILARDLESDKWSITLNKNCSSGNYICHKELIVKDKIAGFVLQLMPNSKVILNGFSYTVRQLEKSPLTKHSFTISQNGNAIYVDSQPNGYWISFDENGNVELGMSGSQKNKVDGLCGYFNGFVDDDKRLPNGDLADSTIMFGDAWFTNDIPKEHCEPHACAKHLQEAAWEMCNSIKHEIFNPCVLAVNHERFVSKCLETACDCLKSNVNNKPAENDKCKCSILQGFVKECLSASPDTRIDAWRAVHRCEISCPAPLVHKDCYKRRCEPSCDNINADDCPVLHDMCFSGCYCPEGTVRKGDNCVSVTDCKDCVCDGYGRAKYVTYDRSNFTFDGNCTYLLSRDISIPGVHTFQVYASLGSCETDPQPIKSGIKGLKSQSMPAHSTCAKSLHILHGPHIIHIQRNLKKSLQTFVDGIEVKKLPFKNEAVHVENLAGNEISVSIPKSQVEVLSGFDNLAFSIRVPSILYGSKMEGLCGDCDTNPDNDLKLNPKKPEKGSGSSLKDIVDSWQADEPRLELDEDDCYCADEAPDCTLLSPDADPCMKLMDSAIFGKCHFIVDPIMYVSSCQQDLCMPGANQKGACDSLEAYARECSSRGVCLDWRRTNLCSYECPPYLQYEACGCKKTCDTVKANGMFDVISMDTQAVIKGVKGGAKEICHENRVEGCFCPGGKVLKNDKCIPEEQCVQCDDDHYAGDNWFLDKCTECKCQYDGKLLCKNETCELTQVCGMGFILKTISDDNECCPKQLCVPEPEKPKAECLDAPMPKCGPTQQAKSFEGTDGCVKYICECKPLSECPILSTQRPLSPGEKIVKETTGCCPSQKIVCDKSKCPPKKHNCTSELFDYVEDTSFKECCPKYKCVAPLNTCIVTINGVQTLKKFGDKWTDPKDPCLEKLCTYGPSGLTDIDQRKMCNVKCDTRSYKLVVEPGECCGKCVQIKCVDGDKFYKPGEVWISADNCTEFSCIKNEDNQFTINAVYETCPDVSGCAPHLRYKKGCCSVCPMDTQDISKCVPVSIAESETVGLIQVYIKGHGLCSNQKPLKGFTECEGSCDSGAKYSRETYTHIKLCDCCSIKGYKDITVSLTCNDGHTFDKNLQIPADCKCQACTEAFSLGSNSPIIY